MSNSIDPDETAHDEPSHLDLCCLQNPILSPTAVKELNSICKYLNLVYRMHLNAVKIILATF